MMVLNFSVMLCILMLSTALYAAKTGERTSAEYHEYYQKQARLLQHYQQVYAGEKMLFDYCLGKYNVRYVKPKSFQFGSGFQRGFPIGSKVGSCMRKQIKLKNKILKYAQDQLGGRSLAQGIYDGCTDYYPKNGVARISKCVKTKLVLDSKLEDDIVEKRIYQKCDSKWRKHGSSAINNCSIMEANYYREKGKFRER